MAPWIIPALKAVLPHITTIVSAAKPMFSQPRANEAPDASMEKQIAELQTVAAQNDSNIRELASQLQKTLTALEQAAALAQAQSRQLTRLCWIALGVSLLAIAIALTALLAS
jgi:hypothetical protein